MEEKGYLILENGKVFPGVLFGAGGETTGEVVFTTAMTGYLETLTDPSYYGQIVVQTFPLIGNYGVIPADFESGAPRLQGYIVREWCQEPSNFRCAGGLDAFLKEKGIVGLSGIDTRALTRIVREHGVMNGRISRSPDLTPAEQEAVRDYRVTGAVRAVSCHAPEILQPEGSPLCHVVLWDFGAKENIRRELVKRGCRVTAVDASATAADILALKPDGLMLSNGPGDPAENVEIVAELRKLMETGLPAFGICLGHQLLALSMGGRTEKMKYGHRGANQPAVRAADGRVFITSQNHGYQVVGNSLPGEAVVSYVNGNDGSCEGVTYTHLPAFSVQFHPEAAAGPQDTSFLFDDFVQLMKGVDAPCR